MPLEVAWKILHLVWVAKGHLGEGVSDLIQKACPHVTGLAYPTLNAKVRSKKVAPPEIAEYVIERMPVLEGFEERAKLVRLGLAALKGEPLPEGTKPAEVAQSLRAEFPADEVASKLADALAKQGGSLDALRAKLEALLSALASSVTGKLDALAGSVAVKLDALASSVVSGFAALASMLADIRRTLHAVNGKLDKLDSILAALGVVSATVNDLDAKADLAALAREREHRSTLRAVGRVGGVVCLLGLVGFAAFLVLLASGRLAWAHREGTTASATQAPAPLVLIVNGATGTMIDLRTFLGAIVEMGKKTEENWVPKEVLPFQKLAKDCDASLGEEAINGGCWVPVDPRRSPPPCGKLFRHGDTCYRPVAADPTKPVGLFPDQR